MACKSIARPYLATTGPGKGNVKYEGPCAPIPPCNPDISYRMTISDIVFNVPTGIQPTSGDAWRGVDRAAFEFGLALTAAAYEGMSYVASNCEWIVDGYRTGLGCEPDDMPGTPITGPYCKDQQSGNYCVNDLYLQGDQQLRCGVQAGTTGLNFAPETLFSLSGIGTPDCFDIPSFCANNGQCPDNDCIEDPIAIGFMCGGLPCIGVCGGVFPACCGGLSAPWFYPIGFTVDDPAFDPSDMTTYNRRYGPFFNNLFSPQPSVEFDLTWTEEG